MGWTFNPRFTKEELVAERTDRTIKRYTSTDGTPIETEVLAHSLRGNHLWKVVRYKKADKEELYIALDLLAYDKKHGAGYKDMEEESGPYAYDCPLKFLDMVPEKPRTAEGIEWDNKNHGGLSWRDRVRQWHSSSAKERKEREKIVLKEGGKYALKTMRLGHGRVKLYWVRITGFPAHYPRHVYATANDGNTYRFNKNMLGAEMGEKEVTFEEMNASLGGMLTT